MAINQQVRHNRKTLSTSWIDYKKAYDSVPHSWLMRVLELYKINATLRAFLMSCMRQWRTVLFYPESRRTLGNGDPIKIERGIFQGDALSPFWFCLALNPLSTLLEGSGLGYRLRRNGHVISHLLYMDDLKLFAHSSSHLTALLKVTEDFSNAIRMEFVLKSLLAGGNKVRAYNGWVIPLLMYALGILKCTQTELDALDTTVHTLLTAHRMHQPRSSTMRLYISRKCGGRGFLNANTLHNREKNNLREYFLNVDMGIHGDIVAVDNEFTPLFLAKENWRRPVVLSTWDRSIVWQSKELHGRFYRALHGPDVDLLASVSWFRFGDFFGETDGFICAIMDEVVMTKNYRRFILKDGTLDVCRACHRPGESLGHIISGCSRLANGEYLHRHNQVAKIIHQQLALKYNLLASEVPYYSYAPEQPDIGLIDRHERRAVVVVVAVPHDDNLVKAEKDKENKYVDLAREIVDMWDIDSAIVVPIIISAHGLIAKSLDKHLKRLATSGHGPYSEEVPVYGSLTTGSRDPDLAAGGELHVKT
ncbi:hypothetical protein evm_013746 [Chilo suppressalis]|nr:hypothetical protein evm_013746 [Chilo suppressalis]